MYPETAARLVLENPIGLEDYRKFVPYVSVDEQYRSELKATSRNIRNYHKSYFVSWLSEFGSMPRLPSVSG